MSFSVRNVIDNIVKFRWLIAIIVFIVCISLKLHFSSMGEFNRLLPTVLDESKASMYNIHGKSRAIRSDEWMVHTCRYFSQKYNNYAKYSTFHHHFDMRDLLSILVYKLCLKNLFSMRHY